MSLVRLGYGNDIELSPNASLTARAPWKGVGGGSLFRVLPRPYLARYYRGRERSSGLLGVTWSFLLFQ
jgi:hypothetical protein